MDVGQAVRDALENQVFEHEPGQAALVLRDAVASFGPEAVAGALLDAAAVALRRMVAETDEAFDLDELIERKQLAVDYVYLERSEIEETGDYDLEGLFVRLGYAIDSIGAKRVVLDTLESLTGTPITEVQIVGGGSRNRLLNQFTADATGRTVLAGPVEATALGNIAMQMVATGAVGNLAEARRIIASSFPVDRFEPIASDRWQAHYRRFQDYVELTCV
jgi:hypothetical protein